MRVWWQSLFVFFSWVSFRLEEHMRVIFICPSHSSLIAAWFQSFQVTFHFQLSGCFNPGTLGSLSDRVIAFINVSTSSSKPYFSLCRKVSTLMPKCPPLPLWQVLLHKQTTQGSYCFFQVKDTRTDTHMHRSQSLTLSNLLQAGPAVEQWFIFAASRWIMFYKVCNITSVYTEFNEGSVEPK